MDIAQLHTDAHAQRLALLAASRAQLEAGLPSSAVFFAEALLALSAEEGEKREAVYELGRALVRSGQARRAAHLLRKHNAHLHDARSLLLAATALLEVKDLAAGLELLPEGFEAPQHGLNAGLHGALHLARGKLLDAADQPALAATAYQRALLQDPLCSEALEKLADRHLLPPDQLRALFYQVCEALPQELSSVRALYATKLRVDDSEEQAGKEEPRPARPRADANLARVAADAECFFYQGRLQECHRLTKHILDEDPYREGSLLWLYASVLVELGKKRELFAWAHAVAQRHTGKAEAWYAVGCYYLVTGKLESARTYLSKATTLALPAEAGPAWLAFGRAFSEQGEQDQAMAAYRTAHRCLPSSYIPLLCIGTELIRAHNFNLARQYLRQARGLSGEDALVWNELGVVAYHNKQYSKAATQLERAVALWQHTGGDVSSGWEEAMMANLGHAYRKLGRYPDAVACFEQALSLHDSPETHAALAFTHHLRGHLDTAIQHYHTALSFLPNHAFATHMLSAALSAAPLP